MQHLELDTFETYSYLVISLILVVMLVKLIIDFNRGFSNLENQIQEILKEILKEPTFERRSKRCNDPTKVQLSVQLREFMNIKETFLDEIEIIEFIDQYIDMYCEPNYEKDIFTPDERLSKLFKLPLNYAISYNELSYYYLPLHYKVLESDE